MPTEMTSRERLLAVLGGQPTDRVPVLAGHFNEWQDDWKARQPSYRQLVEFCRQRCDGILSWQPTPLNATAPLTSSPLARLEQEQRTLDDGSIETRQTLHTPRGPLMRRLLRHPHIQTVWQVEHLLKSAEDVEVFLSVPYQPLQYDVSTLAQAQNRIGHRGLVLGEIADALCLAADLFDFENFTVIAMTEPQLFDRLLQRFQPAIAACVDAMCSAGELKFFRIYGPEYAAPPFLPPTLFRRYVSALDAPLIARIHQAEAFVRIHCHGRVHDLLEEFIAIGADATDPLEAPPSGNVTLTQAKAITAGRLTIFGNLQLRDLETMTTSQVADMTRQTLSEGMPGGRFAMQTTAEPITIPLPDQLRDNWMTYINTTLECGKYD